MGVLIPLDSRFVADASEQLIPDADAAATWLFARRPEWMPWLMRWQRDLQQGEGALSAEKARRIRAAMSIAIARMGVRHGSWGTDFHAYHNENHALELAEGRLDRLLERSGQALSTSDRVVLLLFSVCHDLRQRETLAVPEPFGANELASIAESHRILERVGLNPQEEAWLYLALELCIAGSTFDARPLPEMSRDNTAELAARGGALAPQLSHWLDREVPSWREQTQVVHALGLAQIASDLDTANVAEPLLELVASAIRLCEEREMRAGRDLTSVASAQPCFNFLTEGQLRYFFELHRFCSSAGQDAFQTGKAANEQPLLALISALREARPDDPLPNECGLDIIQHFARLALRQTQ